MERVGEGINEEERACAFGSDSICIKLSASRQGNLGLVWG